MRNAIIQDHHSHDGHGQRQHQLQQDGHPVRAVNTRSLVQFARDRGLEIVFHDQHVPCADRAGQHQRPHGIHQAQPLHSQEGGYQAARKEHGEGEQERNALARAEGFLREREGGHDGHHQVDAGANQGV